MTHLKRELAIHTIASWAREGLTPDRETIEDINAYLAGHMTLVEFIEQSKT